MSDNSLLARARRASTDAQKLALYYELVAALASHELGSRRLELVAALEEAWDQGNGCGLDGWIGPGRGAGEVDDEAVRSRDRDVDRIFTRLVQDT